MLELTCHDTSLPIYVRTDQIVSVEQQEDCTILTTIAGATIVVKESACEIISDIKDSFIMDGV